MNETNISWTEWTDEEGNKRKGFTWNPVSGCSKVSPGCAHCYAEAWSHRWNRSFEVTLHPEKLKEVKKIPSGAKVFVNSMSDLFHPAMMKDHSDYIVDIITAMESRPDVIFQILTKRPEAMIGWEFLPNVWLGVSVEMPQFVDRIEKLRHCGGNLYDRGPKIRFVSFEPLLADIGRVDLTMIDWIIIGGESGPHHRPMKLEWARNLVRQAKEQGVAVWMKQLGGIRPGGELEDFPEDLRIREFPKEATA